MRNYLLTYLLTPWCRVLLEKLIVLQLVKKFPAFHGTRRFIPALTSVRHLSLSWANPIQSTYPHPTSWRSILILSTHLRLGLPSGLFPTGFPTKTLYTLLSSPISATCPAHLILLDFITRTILGEKYKSNSSSLRKYKYANIKFLSNKLHLKQVFQSVYRHELQTKISQDSLKQEITEIPDWPRRKAVAEFRLCLGHECLGTHLHRTGIRPDPYCMLCSLREPMDNVPHCLMGQRVSDSGRPGQSVSCIGGRDRV